MGGTSLEQVIRKRLAGPGYKRWGAAVWDLILSDRCHTLPELHRAVADLTRRDLAWASRFTENVFHQAVMAIRESLVTTQGLEDGAGDGRIPAGLRRWVGKQFPADDLLRSLDEVSPRQCLELSEFLDLNDLERAVASEQAQRQR